MRSAGSAGPNLSPDRVKPLFSRDRKGAGEQEITSPNRRKTSRIFRSRRRKIAWSHAILIYGCRIRPDLKHSVAICCAQTSTDRKYSLNLIARADRTFQSSSHLG
jgi:hypothetical protein